MDDILSGRWSAPLLSNYSAIKER